jgi:hypothetical protein
MRTFRFIPYDTVAVVCKDEPKFLEAQLEICESPRKDFRLQFKVVFPGEITHTPPSLQPSWSAGAVNILTLCLFAQRVEVICSNDNATPYGPSEFAQDLPRLQDAFIQTTKRFSQGHAKLYLWPDDDMVNHVILDKQTISALLKRTDATDWLKLLEKLQLSPLKLPACFRRFLIPHAL